MKALLLLLPAVGAYVPSPAPTPLARRIARGTARYTPAVHGSATLLATSALSPQVVQAVGLNSALAGLGVAKKQKMLTPAGLAHAWALGVILWGALGWRGWSTCVVYLLCGSRVTKVKMAKKEALGIAEGRGGMRGPENVWGSAATAAVCALGSAAFPGKRALLQLGFVASLATKLSDTCASEIGKAFGKTTYLITTLRLVPPGTEGAVSLEGTAAGALGSVVLTAWAAAIGLLGAAPLVPSAVCVVAAFFATNFESVIGAVAQDKYPWLTNELVNGIMTVVGAAAGMGLSLLL
ncbi:hypothetical protein AB1Y20_004045 [Prymnesium parvum]|uniref:Uncharacterized protein n=1 Tax=Prymnesium parvum TaxID=97485 RepID=A0AB34J6F5_PRYPA